MKPGFFLTGTLAALMSGLAAGSPVDTSLGASGDHTLVERSTGTLKAWTSNGSGCSGNPGYTWTSIGNGCITFNGGDGSAKIVQRLSWSGQTCSIYGYSATGCNGGQRTLSTAGSNVCVIGTLLLSFQVVC